MAAHRDLNMNVISMEGQLGSPHALLAGRPPVGEYLGFIKLYSMSGENVSNEELVKQWRLANDHVRELERTEIGIADNAERLPVPASLEPLADAILSSPLVKKSYADVPYSLEIVKLDTLVVLQKHVNLSYVEDLKAQLGPNPTDEAIFKLCFPLNKPLPPVQARRVAPGNVFAFVSPSNDLRFLDATLLPPSQIVGYETNGRIMGVIALAIGFGANCFSAISANGRLILTNASHRAFALRDLGVTYAPCLIQHVSREEEFPLLLTPEMLTQISTLLTAPRPPLLKDFFQDRLRTIIRVPSQNRHVRVQFVQDAADV